MDMARAKQIKPRRSSPVPNARFAAWRGNCGRRMPDLACRLSWEKKAMCASFALDNDSLPGKLALNRAITLRDTWAKEAQKR
jgi:hypothetical protein